MQPCGGDHKDFQNAAQVLVLTYTRFPSSTHHLCKITLCWSSLFKKTIIESTELRLDLQKGVCNLAILKG